MLAVGRRGAGPALVVACLLTACSRDPVGRGPVAVAPAGFVGAASCASCHPHEAAAWRRSQHARAMQEATPDTVEGDFAAPPLRLGASTFRFAARDGRDDVTTEGPDGEPATYEVRYTLGVEPLQQVLVGLPGGRLQALPLAWDTRPAQAGGQRWFDLDPGETIPPGDPLHWTGSLQTWNFMCADCHSTGVRENYDLARDVYATTFSDVAVACEACHGPGSSHVRWAGRRPGPDASDASKGLVVPLRRPRGAWTFRDRADGIAEWVGERRTSPVVDTCAPCHSRRRPTRREVDPAAPFLDAYRPELLRAGLYHADGQIEGEVYVWGSFLQSRMAAAGVVCTDCHDPHTASLVASGNALCTRCHRASRYDVAAHHHHRPDGAGARCVSCHMLRRTFMVVDPRRDHSFRVPRPDLHVRLGTPDTCTDCHAEEGAAWAAERVAEWFGAERADPRPWALALAAGRHGALDAEPRLAALVADPGRPAIVRATALAELRPWLGPTSLPAVAACLHDPDPLVRAAALDALAAVPEETVAALAGPLLYDPSRHVRIAAATVLAPLRPELLDAATADAFERAFAEAVEAEMATGERPASHVRLAELELARGRTAAAERELRTALRLAPGNVPALVNLADMRRAQGRDDEGRALLERAVGATPRPAAAVHALGLLEIRSGERSRGIALLAEATRLAPDDDGFAYVYAVALASSGQGDRAIAVLERIHRRTPARRDVVTALVSFEEERGDRVAALRWARVLERLSPGSPAVAAKVRELAASR